MLAEWPQVARSRAPSSGDLAFRHRDGAVRWLHASSAPLIDEGGAITGYIGIVIDITDRVQAEAHLAESEAQLKLLATNATDAVFQLSLDGICRYASPSVGAVIGIAPRLLVGNSMLARFHPDDYDAVMAGWQALTSGAVHRTVQTYRAKPIDRPYTWRWLEANSGLVRAPDGTPQEVIVSIRDITDRKALELDLAAARDAAQVAAQAKSDFLANMSHEIRTPLNGVIGFTELLLASEVTPKQRQQLRMLAESGGDGSIARNYGGTGLGLAISTKLARLLGGELRVESVEAVGTSFFLCLPLDPVDGLPVATRVERLPDCTPAPNSPRVLLAEDHAINQLLTGAMLDRLGCRVTIADNGAKAVYAVEEAGDDPFQLILMDMQMPEVDGLEATRRLRALGIDAATLPIVALTANAYGGDIEACLAAGMQAHLAKPLQMAQLAEALRQWTGGATTTRATG